MDIFVYSSSGKSFLSDYQLDFMTPGIWPEDASFLRQILHILNFL